jgi:DNA-3-methyladenine glycosylase II
MFVREISVPVVQPFELGLSLAFLRGFSPMMGEQQVGKDSLVKSWIIERQPVTVTVRAGEGDTLACSASSPKPVDEGAVRRRVAAFLSAGEDLDAFYALAAKDEAFAPVARRLRGLHHPRFGTPFEAACWGVINQRIPLARARTLKAALVARWGAKGCDAFPEPKTLAKATPAELMKILQHDRKTKAVWSVAQAFAKVDETWLETAPIDEVEAWLRRIYGVGDFTAGFVLYRGLGRPLTASHASFTVRSPKLLEAAKKTYGPTCTATTLRNKGLTYGPHFGLWSLYLWASTFVGASQPRRANASSNSSGTQISRSRRASANA